MAYELGSFDPQATYSAAAEEYEHASRRYWQFLSTRTVERLDLSPGQSVLDVACGTAPAAIAAARRVGPSGRVVGVDYADGMLAIARRNVSAAGTPNVEIVRGDMLALPGNQKFDAVLCVLGIFFVGDMAAAARALWSRVRPGGTLAVTTFGAEVWEPMLGHFIEAAAQARPEIELVLPWRRTENPVVLARALHDGGIANLTVEQQIDAIPFDADDWAGIVLGSALRRIAVDLGPEAAGVLGNNARWAREQRVASLRVAVNYATATKTR
jgi:ubiquinone/menaquinone biosynthesis C-methylase UbiE